MSKPKTEAEFQTPDYDGADVSRETPEINIEEQAVALRGQVGVIAQRNEATVQNFMSWIIEKAQTTDEDQYALMASILAEIDGATSAEDVLREKSALHARDILNTPLILHGFEIREGDYEASDINHYAALTVGRQGTDVTRVVTCGALKVLAKLKKLDEFGEYPYVIWFTEKKTSKGYGVLDMVMPSV